MFKAITETLGHRVGDAFIQNDRLTLQCLLDCTDEEVCKLLGRNKEVMEVIENTSKSLMYELHRRRTAIINSTIT